jgi:hypothetical protein
LTGRPDLAIGFEAAQVSHFALDCDLGHAFPDKAMLCHPEELGLALWRPRGFGSGNGAKHKQMPHEIGEQWHRAALRGQAQPRWQVKQSDISPC